MARLAKPAGSKNCGATGSDFAHAALIKAGDRPVPQCGVGPEINEHFVAIAPAPAFGRVVAFDDRMAGFVKMSCGMAVRRGIATADMAAGSAYPQMNPRAACLEAFFATARAGLYRPYGVEV